MNFRYAVNLIGLTCAWGCATLCCLEPVRAQDFKTFSKIDLRKDWPWWRGPNNNGTAPALSGPNKLDSNSNLAWKVQIPGRGHSSPVIIGKNLFLQTAIEATQEQWVLAFDCQSGKELWKYMLNQGGFPRKNHAKNTEASPTLASDGESLFAVSFHHNGVWCTSLGLNGQEKWKVKVGDFNPKMFEYGYAPSPLLYNDSLIVSFEYDGPSFLVALSTRDGAVKWKSPRRDSISFSSPVVTEYGKKSYLLMSGQEAVVAINPENGKEIWKTPCTTAATCGTMVWDDGVVYASGGFPKQETVALAIEDGKVLWRNNQKAYEQSMIAFDGHVYCLTDNGVLYCWNGKTGKESWKQRLAGPVSSSGVLVGDKIYWANEAGLLWVFRANPERYEEISKNQIGDESFASPAVTADAIYLRVANHENSQRQEYLMKFTMD